MGHARYNNKEWRPAPTEQRIRSIARRRAKLQLFRVGSLRFERARREYLEWEAFSLWLRAIAGVERSLPGRVVRTLQKRCPSFLPQGVARPRVLPLQLLEWIHDHIFSAAKREGWLDALIFYSVRDPRSQRTWAYWEHCEREWKRKRPRSYPFFERWLQSAKKWSQPSLP